MASAEMREFLDRIRSRPPKAGMESVEQQRAEVERFTGNQHVPDTVLIDDFLLAGQPARKYFEPDVREDATVLYLHGGGYSVGSLDSHHSFMAHLAVACQTSVNALGYRLAPEHPYPAALDDAVAAYQEMLQYTNGEKIMIAGDSAGGGLALACALRLKDEDLPLPGCLVLLSPWADLTCSGESMVPARENCLKGAKRYAADHPLDTVGISPVFGDLAGLPPILIQVGCDEVFLDDSTRLEQRAKLAGVSVELQLIDDVFHVFQIYTHLPEAQDALSAIGAFYNENI